MNTVLGIDLGTQSLKAIFYDYETKVTRASASAPLDLMRDAQGKAEQQAAWWLEALRDGLARVPAEVRASVRAIGVSGQQHGLVALDAAGHVLIPVKLWCDTSTEAEVEEITAACGGRERCIELSGNALVTGYTAPKIRWFAKQHPALYARAAHFLLPHDYLNFVLTGRLCMEHGDASGTGLMDVRARRWSLPMLRAVDADRELAALLPPLVGPEAFIGRTTAEAAQAFGLPAGVPVAPGGGDNMMAAIGTGNVVPGRLTMSLGSSGTLYAYSAAPIVDPKGNVAAFASSTGGWLPLLCTMNCTFATELVRVPLGIGLDAFDATLAGIEPGSAGLLVLPFFNGERTPNLPTGRGCVLGLTAHNGSGGHLLRATVEGATYGLKFGIDELAGLGLAAEEIVLTGGGAKSRAWRQIVADIAGLPVIVLEQEEGASFGAALQALWLLERERGGSGSIGEVVALHLTRDAAAAAAPKPANAAVYGRAYAAYRRAVEHMSPLFEQLWGRP